MSDNTIGMMDDAYFVGRREIIQWINETLQLNITKIEQTANACVGIQMLDLLHPGDFYEIEFILYYIFLLVLFRDGSNE